MNNLNHFLSEAKGPISIRMTNDYLFRALLQRNNKVLRGLISSLLHLPIEQIQSVNITNPILLGEALDEKEFFLDINILLNNNTVINLEMQVIDEANWPERSLSYLCRNFDNLNKGDEYLSVKPAIQIGILDFTLFPEHPEFYATYQFLNVKKHSLYSDKLRLSVLDLTHIDIATEEDKTYRINHWASLFKASTWEEIKMIGQNDEYINEASATIYQLTQEEKIRLQCEAREDYYRRQRANMRRYEAACTELANTKTELEDAKTDLENTKTKLKDTKTELDSAKLKLKEQADLITKLTKQLELKSQ